MNQFSSVRLLEVEPDLGRSLPPEERELAAQVALPLVTVAPGELSLDTLLRWERVFGAIVLEGMLLHRIAIGEQAALRLLGPGDMVTLGTSAGPPMLADGGYRVTSPIQLAVLEDHMLLAIRRFPQLSVALQMRMADQQERLTTQLVICQLPRVEDRLLAIMWLLAESWGRVTSSGTALPVSLTHDALGELIGAKRPTVTLAMRELSERGALMRTDQGWLLLERLEMSGLQPLLTREPEVIEGGRSRWKSPAAPNRGPDPSVNLQDMLRTLKADHVRNAAGYRARLELADATRARSREIRERIRRQRLTRRAAS